MTANLIGVRRSVVLALGNKEKKANSHLLHAVHDDVVYTISNTGIITIKLNNVTSGTCK